MFGSRTEIDSGGSDPHHRLWTAPATERWGLKKPRRGNQIFAEINVHYNMTVNLFVFNLLFSFLIFNKIFLLPFYMSWIISFSSYFPLVIPTHPISFFCLNFTLNHTLLGRSQISEGSEAPPSLEYSFPLPGIDYWEQKLQSVFSIIVNVFP